MPMLRKFANLSDTIIPSLNLQGLPESQTFYSGSKAILQAWWLYFSPQTTLTKYEMSGERTVSSQNLARRQSGGPVQYAGCDTPQMNDAEVIYGVFCGSSGGWRCPLDALLKAAVGAAL